MASIAATVDDYQTSDYSQYWQAFGLSQSPFLPSTQYAMYYPVHAWQKSFDYLHNMSEQKRPISLFLGMLGCGKSTLLSQFLAQVDRNINVLSIKADSSVSVANLLSILSENFNLPEISSKQSLKVRLQTLLRVMLRGKRHYMLLIDDAHDLPLDTLAALVNLSGQQKEGEVSLSTVLFGELPLQTRIEDLVEQQSTELPIDILNISPLNLEETQSYLKHRFIKSGLSGRLPFSVSDVAHVHRLSGGLPGRVNRVAEQTLVDMVKSTQTDEITKTVTIGDHNQDVNGHGLLWFACALFMLLLLCAMWLAREPIFPAHHGSAMTRQHQPLAPGFLSISHVESIMKSKKTEPVLADQATDPLDAQVVRVVNSAVVSKVDSNKANVTLADHHVDSPAHPTHAPMFTEIQPKVNMKSVKPAIKLAASMTAIPAQAAKTEPSVATKEKIVPASANVIHEKNIQSHSADQMISQALATAKSTAQKVVASTAKAASVQLPQSMMTTSGYTLQLVAVKSEKALNSFLGKHHLDGHTLQVKMMKQGEHEPWTMVLMGHYQSAKEAKAAVSTLPQTLKDLKPWVRPMQTIKAIEIAQE